MKMTNIMYGHIFIALALPERKTTCFNLTSLSLAYLGLQPVLLLSNSGAAVVATLLSEAAAEVLDPVLPITLVKQAPLFNFQHVEFCSSSSDTGSAPVFLCHLCDRYYTLSHYCFPFLTLAIVATVTTCTVVTDYSL